jgi:hypothetical protein
MNRRDQQIALASALGGGYVDASSDTQRSAQAGTNAAPVVAAR